MNPIKTIRSLLNDGLPRSKFIEICCEEIFPDRDKPLILALCELARSDREINAQNLYQISHDKTILHRFIYYMLEINNDRFCRY